MNNDDDIYELKTFGHVSSGVLNALLVRVSHMVKNCTAVILNVISKETIAYPTQLEAEESPLNKNNKNK